ncbi:type IV pilin-like G/H family protein [Laspinema palackyanum]|uniref:type IV pilin-like G/H family protein n=1 Tax=Laspinema palackyanum TaxID=3231601 RepID=UPI00345DE556|nr:prepilin-type N-terminal cleavage/methylation domain-containing protein [Laspinema sp. D2c]
MKTEFKTKFLQHLNIKKQEEGFTLIELLVVVIIIGILAAVALPSLLSQANKAKQVEARNNVGAMNRAQQAFFLEKGRFGAYSELGVGIQTETTNYKYEFNPPAPTTANSGLAILASTLTNGLKPYTGLVWAEVDETTSQSTTRALLCEEKLPKAEAGSPTLGGAATDCGAMVNLGE